MVKYPMKPPLKGQDTLPTQLVSQMWYGGHYWIKIGGTRFQLLVCWQL